MKILAIGAHPDDVELGCGGTLARHVADGDVVHILFLATGAMARLGAQPDAVGALRGQAEAAARVLGTHPPYFLAGKDNRLDGMDRLDIIRWVEEAVKHSGPEVVYTHYGSDRNLDHRITHDAVLTACRPTPRSMVRRIMSFEVPSSTEWGPGPFWPTVFVDVTKYMAKKLRALECYRTEMRDAPHPRSVGAVEALANWRGATAGVHQAEAFQLVREVR